MPRPNIAKLTSSYFEAQHARLDASRERIVARLEAVANGRVIPEADDLEINTGRRLEASVLFLDICKFSQRPAETPHEQDLLLRVLNLFFTEMVHIVEDFGGVVEKNTGDGLMAYFVNSGDWDGDVRQRAVAAAMTMFQAADSFINPVLLATPVDPVHFRVCIDHGNVTIARMGARRRFNNIVAVGTTANIACKMLARADSNTLLLGEGMLEGLPRGWWQYVTLHEHETGWIWRSTQEPYRFWKFTGRWKVPEL